VIPFVDWAEFATRPSFNDVLLDVVLYGPNHAFIILIRRLVLSGGVHSAFEKMLRYIPTCEL
jgi:hypothetical protein